MHTILHMINIGQAKLIAKTVFQVGPLSYEVSEETYGVKAVTAKAQQTLISFQIQAMSIQKPW